MSIDTFLLSSDTTDLDYPEIRPTLDLNFARVKALDPRITFTRASGGSYVGADGLIKLAGVNEARFDHNPYTGESLGLLVEEARTNLFTYSEELNDASWIKFNASITANVTTAPDGTLTGDKLVADATSNFHSVVKFFTFTSGTAHTLSIFAKAGEYQYLSISAGNTGIFPARVTFDLISGTVSSRVSGTGSIQSVGNGWYRCSVSATATATDSTGCNFGVSSTGSRVTYTGDGTSGIFIWGAQIEQGSFPTSYIPTVASTRTRAADDALITGKNFSDFYNSSEFTMRCIFSRFSNNSPPYTLAITSSAASGADNFPSIRIRTDGNRSVQGQAVSKENIVVYNNNVSAVFDINQPCNAAIAVKSGDTIYSDSGKLAPVSNVTGSFDGATTLHMGRINGILNGHIRNVTYYPKRLPNAQLQALTR